MVGPFRLLIADQQALFREAVRAVLEAESDLEIVAQAGSGSMALSEAERSRPDVALIDAGLPVDGGISTAKAMSQRVSSCRVLILAADQDEHLLLDAMESGVDGFMTKASALDDVIDAIRRVVRGEVVVPTAMLGPLLRTLVDRRAQQDDTLDRLSTLTGRETQVLQLLVQGSDNATIGETLGISPQTARTHVQKILSKLHVHSRLEAAAFVMRGGVLDALGDVEPSGPAVVRMRRLWRSSGASIATN